jgi:spore coat protein A
MSWRRVVSTTIVVAVALAAMLWTQSGASAQMLLDPVAHPKFVNSMPEPLRIMAGPSGRLNMQMREVTQWLGLYDSAYYPLYTTVWGYGKNASAISYPGPTIEAWESVPLDVLWMNKLPKGKKGGHLLPVDDSIHIADPMKFTMERGYVPTVTHLHGGHTESASDGLPEAWFTQNFTEVGPTFVKPLYHYDNDQEAATLWYHDHALGITRLNVYAGLAGFYLLRDDNELSLIRNCVLPDFAYEKEIVIQDRMFTTEGELFLPSTVNDPGGEELPPTSPVPSVIAEFFGNFILVNGMAWPYLEVEPRKYRLRMLNGSDSRFYVLNFGGMPFMQIGTDNGFLESPEVLTELLLAPGERADLVVDFSGLMGQNVMLLNTGPDEPFKGPNVVQAPADPATTGQIMQIRVNQPFDMSIPEASVTMMSTLNSITPLPEQDAATIRQVVLFEGLDQFGRLQPLLGIYDPTLALDDPLNGSLSWFQDLTELPFLDDIEIWEIYNTTEDAHPIHLHLVAFQPIDRESFTGAVVEKDQPQHGTTLTGVGGILTSLSLNGDNRDPEPNEQGLKDTIVALPGEVTRVIAKFDRVGRYVWHCHILSHEDHEMMRPYEVLPIP